MELLYSWPGWNIGTRNEQTGGQHHESNRLPGRWLSTGGGATEGRPYRLQRHSPGSPACAGPTLAPGRAGTGAGYSPKIWLFWN
jgi:hypothetical protein